MLINSVLSTGRVVSEDVTLTFPKNVIPGSARCSVSVIGKAVHGVETRAVWQDNSVSNASFYALPLIGDLMGRALKNLDKLLQMPTGCGEQRMIGLGPNIYILQYLEVTGQLTASIRLTATDYLQSGMDEQIHFKCVGDLTLVHQFTFQFKDNNISVIKCKAWDLFSIIYLSNLTGVQLFVFCI